MANKVDVDVVTGAGPLIERFSRQVREAIRNIATNFGGALNVRDVVWAPFGVNGQKCINLYARVKTTDATQTRLLQVPLRDKALTDVSAKITGFDGSNEYRTNIEATFTRNGTTVTTKLAATKSNEDEDVAGWDTTISTTTIGTDVYLLVLVTGAASTTISWSATVVIQEEPHPSSWT